MSASAGTGRSSAVALQAAVQRHQSGALVEAEALYRQVLASEPRNADALHLLGVACSQQDGTTKRWS